MQSILAFLQVTIQRMPPNRPKAGTPLGCHSWTMTKCHTQVIIVRIQGFLSQCSGLSRLQPWWCSHLGPGKEQCGKHHQASPLHCLWILCFKITRRIKSFDNRVTWIVFWIPRGRHQNKCILTLLLNSSETAGSRLAQPLNLSNDMAESRYYESQQGAGGLCVKCKLPGRLRSMDRSVNSHVDNPNIQHLSIRMNLLE